MNLEVLGMVWNYLGSKEDIALIFNNIHLLNSELISILVELDDSAYVNFTKRFSWLVKDYKASNVIASHFYKYSRICEQLEKYAIKNLYFYK